MGFLLDFLDSHTSIDWNGDGKIDSWDDALEVAMLTQMLDDDAREEPVSARSSMPSCAAAPAISETRNLKSCAGRKVCARKTLTRAISTRFSGGWIGTEPLRGR